MATMVGVQNPERSEEGKSRWMSCQMSKMLCNKWAEKPAQRAQWLMVHTLPEDQIEVELFRGLC